MNRIENINFDQYAVEAERQYFIRLSEITHSITERFEQGVTVYGDPMPWQKTHEIFRFRMGELTLWAGINGHGKSLVTSHVCAHLMRYQPCLIASLEMTTAATAYRMLRQMIGNPKPTKAFIYRAISWASSRLWLYDQLDTVPARRIIGMCIYAVTQLGIRHIFIDSLMKCGIRSDDFDAQDAFVDRLAWIAKHYDCHIHLVHHMRKGANEEDMPNKFDLKGSGGIADLADNIIIVHRNKAKERKIEHGDDVEDFVPDATLSVEKQRHGEWEGKIKLWFDKTSHQYLPGSASKIEHFTLENPVDDIAT